MSGSTSKTAPATAVRRAGKPAGRKTANRFANLAGGHDTTFPDTALAPPLPRTTAAEEGGLIAAMTAAADTSQVVHLPVSDLAPHPYNSASRSQPAVGDPKWDELVAGVRANGVRLPLLVVTREAFIKARPANAEQIPDSARYVLVYGHRRRAAALAVNRPTVPAVIDDSVMDDDGDIDDMAIENLGRKDLSELDEAELYARYADLGLTQRAIADRLGVNQATISRRLSLLLLTPEVRQAQADGHLPTAEAAVLGSALPYGPARRWQKGADDDQGSDARRAEQIQAMFIIRERGWSASRAADRVIAERQSRRQAADWGVRIVEDIVAELGENPHEYRVADYDPAADQIAAIDPAMGFLQLYVRPAPQPEGDSPTVADRAAEGAAATATSADRAPGQKQQPAAPAGRGEETSEDEDDLPEGPPDGSGGRDGNPARQAAQTLRREACATLISIPVSTKELLNILVDQYLSGVAARCATSAVSALLRDWDAHAPGTTDKVRSLRAWHRAVAAAELHTSELKDRPWDEAAIAHVQLLIEKVGYQPTPWERRQITAGSGS